MKFKVIWIAGLMLAATAGTEKARGAFLFSETLTGAQLYGDSRVTFPTRTPVLQGTSLLFDAGNSPIEKLLVMELLPQYSLNPNEPVIVHSLVNFTVMRSTWPTAPEDHDPGIGVGDGTLFGGFLAGDNFGGDGSARLYHDLGTVGQGFIYADELFTGAGYPAIGGSLTVEARITLTSASTEIYGAFGSKSGSHTFAEGFDLNAALNFVFFAHDAEERYQLNWITVEVEGTRAVPEPASIAMWSLGALGLVFARRKRQQMKLAV